MKPTAPGELRTLQQLRVEAHYLRGDKEGPERFISDRIRRCLKSHGECHWCGGKIEKGTLYEDMFVIWEGPFGAKLCQHCLSAIAIEYLDEGTLAAARFGRHR